MSCASIFDVIRRNELAMSMAELVFLQLMHKEYRLGKNAPVVRGCVYWL